MLHGILHRYLGAMGRPFEHRLRVRYGECDPQGIVFNAHYLAFFDIALTELWRAAFPGGYRAMTEGGIDLVVAEARCRYLAPAGFDDELAIEAAVVHLGTTSMRMELAISRAGEPVVAGELRHVFVDLATREKIPVPPGSVMASSPGASSRRPRCPTDGHPSPQPSWPQISSLVLIAADHVRGELLGAGVAAEVGGADAGRAGLEHAS